MSDPAEKIEIKPNTLEHETTLALVCKGVCAGTMDMMVDVLNIASGKLQGTSASVDPLSIERFIHLAEKLSTIATSIYDLGERCRTNGKLFQTGQAQ